jgi:hypothetical protein
MKYLMVLLLVGAMGFSVYKQHEENTALKAELNSSRQQVAVLQKKIDGMMQARRGYPTPGLSAQPAGQGQTPPSGAWMRDPNHVSPLGTPSGLGKNKGL